MIHQGIIIFVGTLALKSLKAPWI